MAKNIKKSLVSTLLLALAFAPALAISAWDLDESLELDKKAKEAKP